MKETRALFILLTAFILAAAELAVVLTTVPPADAGNGVVWLFFGSLFACAAIGLSFVWHPIRAAAHPRLRPSRWTSLRHCALFAGVLTASLLLRSLSLLSLWDLLPLALSAVLIELFFEADKRPAYHEPSRPA